MSIFSKFFGDHNQKSLDNLQPIVDQINQLEPATKKLSDEELKNKTKHFKQELTSGKSLDDILPEAFAVVREASVRTTGMRHFDVQLLGGIILHQGKITEMRTGEGKTLVATLPLYLNALAGQGAHLVTVNDYLARCHTAWMGQIYQALGLSVGNIQHDSAFLYDPNYRGEKVEGDEEDQERDNKGGFEVKEDFLKPVTRQEAYQADITYGTNNEFGFDYLRDNMVGDFGQMVQRPLHYALIDEIDSVLIDEARTPLIISAPAEESTEKYHQFASLVPRLKENTDFNIDEKMRATTLTEKGIANLEKMLGLKNIYEERGIETVHHIEQALKAHTLFQRDRDYVVKGNEVVIVDEFTGRLMPGRRYSEGLHQAIEAKENVQVQRESRTMATVTFQNYFRMYKKLAGMTGTAATSAEEFANVYKLETMIIPTHKPMVRQDLNDKIYKTELGKFKAVAREVKIRQEKGQPVLIGTVSIEKNEQLSSLLKKEGVVHELLNAKNHEKEGSIIAQAGKKGMVTVATNMAGRGVDIVLGGNPPDPREAETIKEVGGLCVIGTERHEARRIDNQLRGRAGRQGDPGSTQFYVSMEDDLMRLFGSDRMKAIMTTLRVPDDQPIEHKIISKSLESAQAKVEGNNFDARKHVLEYDDVMNRHREVIYKRRKQILEAWEQEKQRLESKEIKSEVKTLKETLLEMIEQEIEDLVSHHAAEEGKVNGAWNIEEVVESYGAILATSFDLHAKLLEIADKRKEAGNGAEARTRIIQYLFDLAKKAYNNKEKDVGEQNMRQIERLVLLRTIDTLWVDHLDAMTRLREGIGLRGYGQKDPLVEYKREGFQLFQDLLNTIQKQVASTIFKVSVAPAAQQQKTVIEKASESGQKIGTQEGKGDGGSRPEKSNKIRRNDPCPCGSGKKYKKCCGRGE